MENRPDIRSQQRWKLTASARTALRISLLYALAGGLWILLSDQVLVLFVRDAETVNRLQTWKGSAFVAITALLFFETVRRQLRRAERAAAARHRAAEALRTSEEHYHTVVDNIRDVIFETDAGGRWTLLNRAWEEITGFSVGESLGTYFLDFVHPDDRKRNIELFLPLIERKEDHCRHEVRYLHRDGGFRWIEVHARLTLNERNEVAGTSGTLRDITAEKQAAEALSESEEHYRALVSASPDAIVVINLLGAVSLASPRALEMFGVATEADAIGRSALGWVAPVDLLKAGANLAQIIADGQFNDREYVLRRQDGSRFNGEINASLLRSAGGRARGVMIIIRDATERNRAEAEHARLATAVEQAGDAIMITDPAGAILYVNPAFERSTGYTRREVIGLNPHILKSGRHDDAFYREMWKTLAAGEVWSGRMINKCKHGGLLEEEATISPIRDGSGGIISYVAVKRDVTREAALETQLRHAQKMEAVGQLAGGVAHDFNNILTAFMMQISMLQSKLNIDASTREVLKELDAGATRAASLTRQLLLFSRRSVMQPRHLDFNEVVDNLLKMLRRLIGEHIKLEFNTGTALPLIHADAGMLEQVVVNLAVNARDAMPGGGRLTLATDTVNISARDAKASHEARPGHFVCLSVSDTGTGMDEAVRKRIFEPFFTTKEAGKGSGLGLATVYGIVTQHKGWVTVESTVGKGSSFRIFLPVASAPAPSAAPAPASEPMLGGSETILLVEDEPAVRATTGTILKRLGYRVITADDGHHALGLWENHGEEIDLLCTDMVMPKNMTGMQLAERLRARKPLLKVILSSGYSAEVASNGATLPRDISFLQKPYKPHTLARQVRECLDRA